MRQRRTRSFRSGTGPDREPSNSPAIIDNYHDGQEIAILKTLAIIGAGVVVLIALAAFVGFQLFITSDLEAAFCELVNALQVAIEAGQDIGEERFL